MMSKDLLIPSSILLIIASLVTIGFFVRIKNTNNDNNDNQKEPMYVEIIQKNLEASKNDITSPEDTKTIEESNLLKNNKSINKKTKQSNKTKQYFKDKLSKIDETNENSDQEVENQTKELTPKLED